MQPLFFHQASANTRNGFALAFFLAVAVVVPATVCAETARPETTASTNYRRIVSLVPSITETLFALGLGDRVVGVSRFCDFPPEVRSRGNIGGLFDRNLEAIVALRPDVIVGMPEGPESAKKLTALGARVLIVKQESVQDIFDSIREIGDVFGARPAASHLTAQLQRQVGEIRRRVGDKPRRSALISLGGERGGAELKNTLIAGNSTYLGELLKLAGARNAYTGDVPYPTISAEGLLALDPEVIIELLPEGQTNAPKVAQVKAAWQSLGHLQAVKSGEVHVLVAEYTVNPGPRFVLTLRDFAAVLHPEVLNPEPLSPASRAHD